MRDDRAQTIKASLVAQLLGDVDRLLERFEAADSGLRDELADVDRAVGQASLAAITRFEHAASLEREAWAKAARATVNELRVFGQVLAASGQRAICVSILAGSLTGIAGGLVVAIFHGVVRTGRDATRPARIPLGKSGRAVQRRISTRRAGQQATQCPGSHALGSDGRY